VPDAVRALRRPRLSPSLYALALVPAGFAWAVTSCAPQPTVASVRSLQGSNSVSFLCLGNPTDASPLRRIDDCTHVADPGRTINDFGVEVGGAGGQGGGTHGLDYTGEVPHLYALVTQSVHGEVAIVDVTAGLNNVLDHDPSTPGNNFLPVGASPTAIVTTPGGTASFVAAAEVGRPALYALPTKGLRPCSVDKTKCSEAAPTISSWPACVLPAAPGAMTLVVDPAVNGQVRTSCGGAYQDPADAGDLGNIDLEGDGRQKLLVVLPSLGEIAVVDAQGLLESQKGGTSACVIERTIPLSADVPVEVPPPPPVENACVNPEVPTPGPTAAYAAEPSGITLGDGKLYVGDRNAPLIHVLDVSDPCDPVELPPLLPTSAEDPTRVVVTSQVAVTDRLSPSFKRYLYAVDADDKSVMAFDVSDGSTTRHPLVVNDGKNPLQPADRVRFAQAPQTLQIVTRDFPKAGSDKQAPFGVACNPDPLETGCTDASPACQGVGYRTSSDFTTGAGPLTLRGTFALVGLSSGQVAVIDIEDYDAPCRGPVNQAKALGCDPTMLASGLVTKDEPSCNIVEPLTPRSGSYLLSNDTTGRHLPGLTTFPLLYDKNSTLVDVDANTARLHATTDGAVVAVNGKLLTPASDGLLLDDSNSPQNGVILNLEDPRVHTADQDYTITYEGALPGFTGHAGGLVLQDTTPGTPRALDDDSAQFCRHGVSSMAAVRERLVKDGEAGDLDALARVLADRVTITNPIADATNAYWKGASCSFQECSGTFGDDTTPTPMRDIVISEAYEDHLLLEAPATDEKLLKCCFPTQVSYEIRPGNQWTVAGVITGFEHHTIADPDTGRCRDSCDPRLQSLNGRARITTDPNAVKVFSGARLSFFVTGNASRRDDQFRFTTEGSFSPLRVVLTNTDRPAVQSRAMRFLPSLDQLVIADGGTEGLLLLNGTLQGDAKQYF
jgi:hypothetical protein